jgi:transposase
MSKKQLSKNKPRPYAPEFRRQMVELVRAGRTPEQLAKEFEPSAQAIRNWVAQADRDEGRREDGLTTVEREELSRLRRENRQLKLERDILSKAAAWFARMGLDARFSAAWFHPVPTPQIPHRRRTGCAQRPCLENPKHGHTWPPPRARVETVRIAVHR